MSEPAGDGPLRQLVHSAALTAEQLEAVLANVSDAVTVVTREGGFAFANPPAARLLGFASVEELLRTPAAEVLERFELSDLDGVRLDPSRLPGRRAWAGEAEPELTIRWRPVEGGTERVSLVRAIPVLDADGSVQYVVNFFRPVPDERRRAMREAFIAEAGGLVGSSLDYASTLRAIADLAVPRLGDWCAIDLLGDDGTLQRVATSHVDPAKVKRLDDLQRRWPWSSEDAFGPGPVIRSGEPASISRYSQEELRREARDEEHFRTLLEVGATSMLSAPIAARGRTLGALTLGAGTAGRRFVAEDRDLAIDLAGRSGIAIDNARMFRGAHEARAAAESAAQTLRKLEQVVQAALVHVSLGDLLPALLEQIVLAVEAETAAILLVDETGERLTMRASHGLGGEVERAEPVPLGEGLAGRVAASRQAAVIDDLDGVELASPMLRERGVRSLVAIPLIAEDRVIGVVHAGSTSRGHFSREDLRLLELIADRIALAINASFLLEAERESRERLSFLAEASSVLASSLDYEDTLARVAELAVPRLGDWCAIDMKADDGSIRRLAVAHVDPEKVHWAEELGRRYTPSADDDEGIARVLATGRPEFIPEVTPQMLERWLRLYPDIRDALLELGLESYMVVPFVSRGRTLGAITLACAPSGRRFGQRDLELAQEVARRAGVAIDNAQLYRQSEERGQAARVLASVGDGVLLVDSTGYVRYWNRAAEAITGLRRSAVVDRAAAEVIPGWSAVVERVPVAADPVAVPRAQSLPFGVGGGRGELWVSVSGASVVDGTVYVFRDLTEERALEALKAEFVSTVSHELRTPLSAIYGAAMTLRRRDVVLDAEQTETMLNVISSESDRLARTVNAILWASRLDTDALAPIIESCDPVALVQEVLDAHGTHLPPEITLGLDAASELPEVAADPDKVRQVLVNLVDNAVKYSPDGGHVSVRVTADERRVRFAVADEGLGIPHADQRRIFDKFYRVDPDMTRGIGGTGLGLYICRELVRRMNGRIWVTSEPGRGSTFAFELPLA